MRNLPLLVNFRIWLSSFALPLSQTFSLSSTKIPCWVVGHSYPAPGPPQACSSLPFGANSRTAGAGTQHSACGGVSDAAFSPSGMLASRWNTQTLSCESTATPPTAPVTHRFGSACDHSGSGSKSGTWPARLGVDGLHEDRRDGAERTDKNQRDDANRPHPALHTPLLLRVPADRWKGYSLVHCALNGPPALSYG